jgi:D-3-phosphoglycerate dehydrogenase
MTPAANGAGSKNPWNSWTSGMSVSPRPLIVIPGDDPPQIAGSPHLKRLHGFGIVELHSDMPEGDEEQVRRAKEATVLINSRGQVTWNARVLEQLPKLQMISLCGIGTDSVDLDAARRLGIIVCNIPGKTAHLVAEHAFALMLSVARRIPEQTRELRAGNWTGVQSVSLFGKTLGVVGTGAIGCEMVRLARPFGMNVVAWSFHPADWKSQRYGFRYVELDELLSQSDVVSLHVKLTDDSRGMIGPREFDLMKSGGILVNTARGAVIDSRALAGALNSGKLAGAGLDVYDVEPLPPDHPILSCARVALTPHSADQMPEGMDLLNGGCVDNVVAYFLEKPQNVVT